MIAVSLLALLAAAPPAPPGDSCLKCHSQLGREGRVGEHLAEYQVSAHGRAQVSCARCHGGEASQADKDKAHQGMFKPTEAASRVNPRNQPTTCGDCHSRVRQAFESSKHARALSGMGTGPSCTTCHTSMGSGVLSVEDVAATCKACHKPGGVAADRGQAVYAARLLVEVTSTQRAIRLADTLVRWSEGRGVKVPGAEKLEKAKSLFGGAAEAWHQFDPARTRESIAEAMRLVDQMRTDLEMLEAGKPIKKKP